MSSFIIIIPEYDEHTAPQQQGLQEDHQTDIQTKSSKNSAPETTTLISSSEEEGSGDNITETRLDMKMKKVELPARLD